MYGISQASSVIRIANPLSLNYTFPSVLVKGDKLNITLEIKNLNPYYLVLTPSVLIESDDYTVDFTYVVYNATEKKWQEMTTYNVSANSTYKAVV